MAYSKKFKLSKTKRIILILTGILCVAVIVFEGSLLYRKMNEKEAAGAAEDNRGKVQTDTMIIARAKKSMSRGELLDASKTELVEVPAELVPDGSVTSLSVLNNMRLGREVAGRELINEMDIMPEETLFEEGDRLIEHNFSEGAVPAEVKQGSTIDIKLFLKGEEDTVVISKTLVVGRKANLLSFYMNGKEQEYIKEAAAQGMLFAVLYLDTSQQASDVTYIPAYDKGRK